MIGSQAAKAEESAKAAAEAEKELSKLDEEDRARIQKEREEAARHKAKKVAMWRPLCCLT